MDISEKIDEIEQNIQEGERMLSVLRKLPESEENNAQIRRFQELVRQLEDFKERYKSIEAHRLNEDEFRLDSVVDTQDQLKSIIELSNTVSVAPTSSNADVNHSNELQEPGSSSQQVNTATAASKATRRDELEQYGQSDELSEPIDPSEWRLHHESQKRQLLNMLSQISRYQELICRLSSLVADLDMSESVSLLNDVGQRFNDVRLRLLSLQSAYETIYSLEGASDEYKASQLKDLRDFLVNLGRSLEVTKECFFTIAGIIKKGLQYQNQEEQATTQTSDEPDEPEPATSTPQTNRQMVTSATTTTSIETKSTSTVSESEHMKNQRDMQLAISQLAKQRDELISKLAEAKANAHSIALSSKCEDSNVSKSSPSEQSLHVDRAASQQTSNSLPKSDAPVEDSLPILKRLQARKEHLEELRGELHSFHFPNGGEGSPSHGSASSNRRSISSCSAKLPAARPRISTRSNAVVSNLDDNEISQQASFSGLEPSAPSSTPQKNQLDSVDNSDSDAITQKCEAVTFQEPEATYLDNTERLYKSMREARIWREEHRHATDALADSSVVATAGGKATDEADDKSGGRLRNGAGGGLSESTSCMDATVMATWGGDSDREEPNEDIGEEEYIEDIPSVVSSRSSRANRRFLNVSVEGDASSARESLGVRIDTQDSSGICMRLPDLGYSPSPHNGGGTAVSRPSTAPTRTSHLHRRQSSRISRSNHADSADISFSGAAGDPIIKILAEKIVNLEFKVEQLVQTCNLLVTENARISSLLLSAAQQHRPALPPMSADWPVSSAIFASPSQQPLLTISTSGVFASPFRAPESLSGLSSVQSLAPAPPTPTLHADKYSDQIQMLAAEVIEQRSRMNQLQNELQAAFQQHHQLNAVDMVPSTSGANSGMHRACQRTSLPNFLSPLAMQAAIQARQASNHATSTPRTPN
ncbi:hypothetical protein Aperf_G00000067898 [Anoplocephala perfoliata]